MKHIFLMLALALISLSATAQKTINYVWALDTITNTEVDTIYLGATGLAAGAVDFQSLFGGQWTVVRTNISGTTSIALKIEATPVASGTTTVWAQVAAGAATTATPEAVTISEMLSRRYRIILTGSGTQSSSYRVYFSGKKKV